MPVVRKQIESVGTSPLPTPTLQANATEEAFGGGRTGSAPIQEGQRLLSGLNEYVQEQQDKANQIAVRDADLELAREQIGIEIEAKKKKGRESIEAFDIADKQWNIAVGKARKRITNPVQLSQFEDTVLKRKLSLDRALQLHTAAEIEAYDQIQYVEQLKALKIDAASNYGDMRRIAQSVMDQKEAIESYGKRYGKPKQWIDNNKEKAISDTHIEVATRMVYEGQIDKANQYLQANKDQILTKYLGIVERAKKEAIAQQEEAARQYENNVERGILLNQYGISELDSDFESKRISNKFYESKRKRLFDVNDDISIPVDEKATRYMEIVERFLELRGATRNPRTGLPETPVTKGDKEELTEFRNFVTESAPYITRKQERAFIDMTQKAYNSATKAKAGLLENYLQDMKAIMGLSTRELTSTASRLFSIFNDDVTVNKAEEIIEEEKVSQTVSKNPNRSRYRIGQIVINPNNVKLEVVKFDERGNPEFRRAR